MQIERAIIPPRGRTVAAAPRPTLEVKPRPGPRATAYSGKPTPLAGKWTARPPAGTRQGQPFRDAEACIIWMVAALAAGEGRVGRAAICEPAEVVKCLDTLYRRRRIDLHHVRILRLWAHRGRAPNAAEPRERADWRIWREALDRLDWPLRTLGIIL